jgi:hypothetical protein
VLAKVQCHNVVVVIHEMHELGIDPTFCVRQPDEPQILRFPAV